jgi:hypothetical protein
MRKVVSCWLTVNSQHLTANRWQPRLFIGCRQPHRESRGIQETHECPFSLCFSVNRKLAANCSLHLIEANAHRCHFRRCAFEVERGDERG